MSRPDQDQRTEEPSQRWLKRLEKDGNVTRSAELTSTVLLAATVLWLVLGGRYAVEALLALLNPIDASSNADLPTRLAQAFDLATTVYLRIVMPLLALVVVVALAAGLAQTRGAVSFKAILPDFGRLSPAEGVRRIFSRRNLVELVKGTTKIVVICTAAWYLGRRAVGPLIGATQCGWPCVSAVSGDVFAGLARLLLPALAVLAVADYLMQRAERLRTSKMTKEEAKRDKRERLGDPEIQRRHRRERKRVQSSGAVASATVVVVSDTVAVALRFVAGDTPLPVVLQVARGAAVHTMTAHARAVGVMVVEAVGLPEKIVAGAQAGDFIASNTIEPVAAIISRALAD